MAEDTQEHYNFDVEYTSTGEYGLHELKTACRKNPGHTNFFPISTLTQEYLPAECQTEEMLTMIKALADLTVRISSDYTSMSRPPVVPGTEDNFAGWEFRGCQHKPRFGTGFIYNVSIGNSEHQQDSPTYCPCFFCQTSLNPHTVWGKVSIVTAAHVICTSDELVHANIDCFYNDDQDLGVSVLTGSSVKVCKDPITKMSLEDDYCQFFVYTHDIDLCQRLKKIDICDDLLTLDLGMEPPVGSNWTFVISHPHGSTKYLSWGEWTSRECIKESQGPQKHRYHYNTPTCPGSSGALVWLLEPSPDKWQKIYVHSAGSSQGKNKSGAVELFNEFITNVVPCRIS